MKVLVTGGAGFVGTNLVEALHKRKDQVVIYDNLARGAESKKNLDEIRSKCDPVIGDTLDFRKLKTTINKGFDIIFHLAAIPSHRLSFEDPYRSLLVNQIGILNVLESVRLCKKKPLVLFASSNKVYGLQEGPWKEKTNPRPEGPYAISKLSSEKMCELYNKYFGVHCVVARYHHAIGKRTNSDLALSIFVENALKNKPLEVHGSFRGKKFISCSANYTHVDDVVRGTLLMARNYRGFDIFNIADKKLTTLEWMAEYIVQKLESKSIIKLIEKSKFETLINISDTSKAKKELGFKAQKTVSSGIDDYIKWQKSRS